MTCTVIPSDRVSCLLVCIILRYYKPDSTDLQVTFFSFKGQDFCLPGLLGLCFFYYFNKRKNIQVLKKTLCNKPPEEYSRNNKLVRILYTRYIKKSSVFLYDLVLGKSCRTIWGSPPSLWPLVRLSPPPRNQFLVSLYNDDIGFPPKSLNILYH
jgi:hypothetical protein